MIVCDKDKLDGNRCNGAPDFIIEIVSPGNPADDYIRKLYYYKNTGVREYWIVDPRRKIVTVNYFEGNLLNIQYSFESTIKVNIYDDIIFNPPHSKAFNTFILKSQKTEIMCINYLSIHIISLI